MNTLSKIALLFVLVAITEATFVFVYSSAAHGYLREPIAAHTLALHSGTIPTASSIDLESDDWVKVAHFETTFSQIQLIVYIIVNLVAAWIFIFGGVSSRVARLAESTFKNVHLSRGFYLVSLSLLITLINIPSLVASYFIGSMRGTSLHTPLSAFGIAVQDTIISIVFTLLTFIPFYYIIDRFRSSWWIIGAIFVSAFSIFTMFISPIVIDPLYYDLKPMEDGTLKTMVRGLAEKVQVPLEDIYMSDTGGTTLESNAMVTGLGTTKRVVLDDTLVTYYTPREIGGIVSHEFGHYTLGHMWYDMVIVTVNTIVTFGLLALALMWFIRRFGSQLGTRDVGSIVLFPLLSTLVGIIGFLLLPANSYVGRILEHQADTFELQLNNDPEAAVSGFKKLAYQSFIDPDPPAFMQWWFGSHPTINERINFFESHIQK